MSQTAVFLCPSCQSVIHRDPDQGGDVACDSCGHQIEKRAALPKAGSVVSTKPQSGGIVRDLTGNRKKADIEEARNLALPPVMAKKPEPAEPTGEIPPGEDELIMPDGSRRVRRRKKKLKKEKHKSLYLFLLSWLGVVGLLFYLFKFGGKDDEAAKGDESDSNDSITIARDRLFLREHFPAVSKNFRSFITTSRQEKQLQLIDDPSELSSSFFKHSQSTSKLQFEGRLGLKAQNVIELPSEPLKTFSVESLWVDESGKQIGAVHVYDGNDWKLDWEAFAAYSSQPWKLFRVNRSRSEGVFRLLVRKKKANDESRYLYLNFYGAPQFGEDQDRSLMVSISPVVEVESRSELGQAFLERWNDFEEGVIPYNSILPQTDPEGYMRIMVKLAWNTENPEKPIMELKDILGVSWYGKRIVKVHEEAITRKIAEILSPESQETPPAENSDHLKEIELPSANDE